ncbi:hypothetical protein [Bacillus ectoiniformans]|uniref:hypothetical protein n=1 Tax=Bacillus ectoiniformans TaxID=1494429 RepID=UPI00195F2245|nr:hypothetical protein [Bacillus ectoiniformans]
MWRETERIIPRLERIQREMERISREVERMRQRNSGEWVIGRNKVQTRKNNRRNGKNVAEIGKNTE